MVEGKNLKVAGTLPRGPCQLRVLSMNIWDVPFLGTARKARMEALGEALANSEYDLCGLQEAWSPETQAMLVKQAKSAGLVYSHTFVAGADLPGGASGGGLLILSRYPIVNGAYLRYGVNGQPYRLHHYDYQGGKGLGMVVVETPSGPVDVFITHLIAQYNDDDQYHAHRCAQALEAANFVNLAGRSPLTLFVGDINSRQDSLVYEIMTTTGGFRDSFRDACPDQPGWTCNVVGTPLADHQVLTDTAEKCTLNARLDYVLYRVNQPASKPDLGTWRLVESSVVHSDNIVSYKGKQYPLSDHYGVCSLFTSHPCDPSVGLPPHPYEQRSKKDLLLHVRQVLSAGLEVSLKQRIRDGRFSLFLLLLCGAFLWWAAESIGMHHVAQGACCAGLACSSVVITILILMYSPNLLVVLSAGGGMLVTTLVLVVRTLVSEGWPSVIGMAAMVALPVGIAFSTFTLLTDTEEVNGMKVIVQTCNALLLGCVPAEEQSANILTAHATASPRLKRRRHMTQ